MSQSLVLAPEAHQAGLSPHDLRRQQVLAAARVCFARSGFHSASMQELCAEAGMSPGALYRYFPSKDAIIEAIAEEERMHATACMVALAGEGSLVDRITAVGMDYLRHSRDRATGGLMVEIWSESIRNTAVGARFNDVELTVRQAFLEALVEAGERGEISEAADVDSLLSVLFAIGDGLVLRLQLEPETDVEVIAPHLRRVTAALLGAPGER